MGVIGGSPARIRSSDSHQKIDRVLMTATHLVLYQYTGTLALPLLSSGGGAGEQ